jgi:EKC/KEOPS complex subunit PCC1/LAGE3
MNDILNGEIRIPFANECHAIIAYKTLIVDTEPRKELINKKLTLEGNTLIVNWNAKEAKTLRVSINSLLDHLDSILQTIQLFEN